MKVRLLKRWRQWPIGQKMEVADGTAKELIRDGFAEEYHGDMKSTEKFKTEFFNPKKNKRQ